MRVAGGAHASREEKPDEKRGAGADDEEDPAISEVAAMAPIPRRLEDDTDILKLPSPCTGRRGENPLMRVKTPP